MVPLASDKVNGVQESNYSKVIPTQESIWDGSYSVFTRNLHMDVDSEAWDLVRKYLQYGFSTPGQAQVSAVGYVTVAKRQTTVAQALLNQCLKASSA